MPADRDRVSRMEFMSRLGLVKVVDPMIDSAYELAEAFEDEESHSSGHDWSTSFHASEFPGDDPYACARKAIYGLMGTPKEPVDRRGRMFMDAGKNLELELVRRFGRAGWLLSADQTAGDEFQTNFTDEHIWLSGSPDLIVLPFGWDRPHIVEVKGKAQRRPPKYRQHIDPLAEMKALREGPTPKHVKQLGAYIGMAHREFHKRVPMVRVCRHTWSIAEGVDKGVCPLHRTESCLRDLPLKPVVDGTLLYVAMDDGSVTHEYLYSLDKRAFEEGRTRLHRWRQHFLDGELPARPEDWMWSKEPYPCRLCPFKRDVCKPDDKAGVARLEESHAIPAIKANRPDYDYRRQRQKVLGRWGVNDPQEVQENG